MNLIRKLVIGTSSLLCVFIVLLFVKSLGINYIVPNNTSYEITGMQTGIDANKFNSAIKNFTKKNNVSAIKVFNVPSKANNSEVTLKSYIYGKPVKLPAEALANKAEFETSDIRYPLYFIGGVKPQSVEAMFKKNGIQFSKLNENWNWNIWDFLNSKQILALIELIFLILTIVLILINLKLLKKINLKNLLGTSNKQDAYDSFISDIKIMAIVYLLGTIGLLIFMKLYDYQNSMRIALYFEGQLLLVETIILGLVAFLRSKTHSQQTIVSAIKGESQSKASFMINMVIKGVVEIFICVTFASLFGVLKHNQELNSQLQVWNHTKTYYTVNLGSKNLTEEENTQVNDGSAKLFNYLARHGGMLSSYQEWDVDKTDVIDFYNGNVLNVNPQYLVQNKVINDQGNRILVPKDSQTTYVLIPSYLFKEKDLILNKYRQGLFLNEAEKATGKTLKMQAIKIKDNQKTFTYSVDALNLGHYNAYANSPVILVLSNQSLGGLSSKNIYANSIWSSYLSSEAFLSPNLETLRAGLQATGMTRFIGGIVNTKSYVSKQIVETKKNIQLIILVITLSIGIAIIENLAFNSIYFANNKKKIALKRLLGANFIKIYKRFLLLITGMGIFEMLVVLLITGNLKLSLMLLILSIGIETILLSIQNKILNKKLPQSLKGD